MKIIYVLFMTVLLTSCSKVEMGDWQWDPKTAMMRVTFGVSK